MAKVLIVRETKVVASVIVTTLANPLVHKRASFNAGRVCLVLRMRSQNIVLFGIIKPRAGKHVASLWSWSHPFPLSERIETVPEVGVFLAASL